MLTDDDKNSFLYLHFIHWTMACGFRLALIELPSGDIRMMAWASAAVPFDVAKVSRWSAVKAEQKYIPFSWY